jgi:hypothetical protein
MNIKIKYFLKTKTYIYLLYNKMGIYVVMTAAKAGRKNKDIK